MTPPTVNAYYNPTLNEIVFPAGILQPPFFDVNADDAVNYGGIGAVIGHEITHGFDDQGRRFDAQGKLATGGRREDAQALQRARRSCRRTVSTPTSSLEDLHVNGKLTLGENIADLGGVTIAYAAYQKSLDGKPGPVIDGFTGDQRFFMGFAQVWESNVRPEYERLLVNTDPHPLDRFGQWNGIEHAGLRQGLAPETRRPMVLSPDQRTEIRVDGEEVYRWSGPVAHRGLLGGACRAPSGRQRAGPAFFDVANLFDRSTPPGVDFNQFANGGWIAHHEIPAISFVGHVCRTGGEEPLLSARHSGIRRRRIQTLR